MGVPAFFRWLSRKYPSVIVECVENKNDDGTGHWIPEDATLPNPNGIEFDNLYLDMNGIIHPCTHPEDKPAPKNEDEMMVAIFECIDRLFNIVRPRKVLYMAIDGVAPRAKMNQQRSRRFRASKETVEKQLEVARIREKLITAGAAVPPEKPKGEHFDSNCITPGTPFMERLSKCLHYYIHDRLNNNAAWRDIKVFLSDANVPGEGEHKIMDFIRRQRSQSDHDPNTQHVLCGADADLIMLGLATHEPNFTIIREEFLPNKPRPCEICSQIGHEMDKCEGLIDSVPTKPDIALGGEVQFIFVRLCVLKEYLRRTLDMPNLPFKYDFERVLDDWVFMCFFVGNDFLPHLPSLEIREGAIDRLIELYKKCVYKTNGYLTDSGEVNLDRVQMILRDLGFAEDEIFRQRQKRELSFRAREKMNKRRKLGDNHSHVNHSKFGAVPLGRDHQPEQIPNARQEMANFRMTSSGSSSTNWKLDGVNSKSALEAMIRPESQGEGSRKRTHAEMEEVEEEEEDPQANDEVRLWESGFKDRYYESKFDVNSDNLQFRSSVALQYIKGLCWVLKYYYQGCASWNWYFPYHYAPFASDFVNIGGLSTKFEKGTTPFNPLEQLMGVFPAASSTHVPKPWAKLMSDPILELGSRVFKLTTNILKIANKVQVDSVRLIVLKQIRDLKVLVDVIDKESVIIDFYPEDFKIDLNGKKFAWQGVALLPFVDEKRLIKAVQPYYGLLTPAEIKRNQRGDDRLYISTSNANFKKVFALYKNKSDASVELPILLDGVQGTILIADECVPTGSTLPSPILGQHEIEENSVVTVRYRDPTYPDDYIFKAERLTGAIDPPTVLAPENRSSDYRPQIGFNRNFPQASLGAAGHRMVNHHSNNSDGQRHYASIPPPQQQQYRGGGRNDNNSYNRGHNTSGENNYQNRYQNNQNNFNYGYNNRGGRGGGQFFNEQNRYNNRDDNNRGNQGYRGRGGGRGGYQGNNDRSGFWRN